MSPWSPRSSPACPVMNLEHGRVNYPITLNVIYKLAIDYLSRVKSSHFIYSHNDPEAQGPSTSPPSPCQVNFLPGDLRGDPSHKRFSLKKHLGSGKRQMKVDEGQDAGFVTRFPGELDSNDRSTWTHENCWEPFISTCVLKWKAEIIFLSLLFILEISRSTARGEIQIIICLE